MHKITDFQFFEKNERYGTKVDIKGFPMVPHMLGLAAGFMHFLPLLKTRLILVVARKELAALGGLPSSCKQAGLAAVPSGAGRCGC